MSLITIPNRPAGTDVRVIEQILADFDAITNVVNGNLDSTNLSAATQSLLMQVPGTITSQNPAQGGSRQPNLNRPTFVALSFQLSANSAANIYIGGTSPANFPLYSLSSAGSIGQYSGCAFIVPAKWYYMWSGSGPVALTDCTEYSL